MTTILHIEALKSFALDRKFSLPAGFSTMPTTELQKCYNGIGADWMPKFLRKFITWGLFLLEAAALVHDYEFTYAEKTYRNFTVANARFVYNSARSRRLFTGLACGIILQLFGWTAWKGGGV